MLFSHGATFELRFKSVIERESYTGRCTYFHSYIGKNGNYTNANRCHEMREPNFDQYRYDAHTLDVENHFLSTFYVFGQPLKFVSVKRQDINRLRKYII